MSCPIRDPSPRDFSLMTLEQRVLVQSVHVKRISWKSLYLSATLVIMGLSYLIFQQEFHALAHPALLAIWRRVIGHFGGFQLEDFIINSVQIT